MLFKEGYWWPHTIQAADIAYQTSKLASLQWIILNCPHKNNVIQAGGSYGVWPSYLSHSFLSVYTFEPDNISFEYLTKNCSGMKNVFKFQCALGDQIKPVHFMRKGAAMHRIMDSVLDKQTKNEQYLAGVWQITVDSLNIPADALLFDVEGNEAKAIMGAINTIKKYKPLVLFQMGEDQKGKDILTSIEYKMIQKLGSDAIWAYKGRLK